MESDGWTKTGGSLHEKPRNDDTSLGSSSLYRISPNMRQAYHKLFIWDCNDDESNIFLVCIFGRVGPKQSDWGPFPTRALTSRQTAAGTCIALAFFCDRCAY